MKTKLSIKSLFVLCCFVSTLFFTKILAQETVTVWVFPTGTYNATTLQVVTYSIATTCPQFSSDDYNNAVSEITGGRASRIFKIGNAFNLPDGFVATEVTIYGWPRNTGSTYIKQLVVDGKTTDWSAGTTPYTFADCGAAVAAGNRTRTNCSIHKIAEISETNPVTSSFATPVSSETHAFYKIVLKNTNSSNIEQALAFPGAEGHGRFTTGGRGGNVVKVTTLADNASGESVITGSLRWALQQPSPKTIVFDVSGTIMLKQRLSTGIDNVTIAGQTSPGGICVAGYDFTVTSNNVIIRFVSFRPGDASGGEPDGLGGMDKSNIIIDHCSTSWSVDECLSVYGMENLTVQWCIASEALRVSTHGKGTHGYGGVWGGNKASYHHNLIAHCESRVPRLGPRATTQENEYVDIRNNVFYNWGGNGCYGGEGMKVNLVNNYYKPGPATDKASSAVRYRIAKIDVRTESYIATYPAFAPMKHVWGKYYIDGNVMEDNAGVTNDNWTNGVYAQQTNNSSVDNLWTATTRDTIRLYEPLDMGSVTTHTAAMAYERVLDYVGNSLYRDNIDNRIISDVRERKATFTASGNSPGFINTPMDTKPTGASSDWTPWLPTGSQMPPVDANGDGISDSWFSANVPSGKTAKDKNEQGYTYLEVYLNALVEHIINAQNEGGSLTGVPDAKTKNTINPYAYTAKNILYLHNLPDCYIEIYNVSGMFITKRKVTAGETSFNLPTGAYVVKIISNDGSKSLKVISQNIR